MGVKPIEEVPFSESNEKMEILKNDVREIIEKRIRVCEITDPPYPTSTMRERLQKAMRTVLWEMAEEGKDGRMHTPGSSEVFRISYRHIQKKIHWYVMFDVDKWEEEWRQFREAN